MPEYNGKHYSYTKEGYAQLKKDKWILTLLTHKAKQGEYQE